MSLQQGELDLRSLGGSVGVITGAGNGGIGWGLAKHCATLAMDVVVVDLHQSLVDAAQAELAELFPSVRSIGIQCDVADPESMAACCATVQAEFPGQPIGACFANAGGEQTSPSASARPVTLLQCASLADTATSACCQPAAVIFNKTIVGSDFTDWVTTMNVNVLGVVNTIKAFIPLMQKQSTPAIMCSTASIGGLVRGDGGASMYQVRFSAIVLGYFLGSVLD